MKRKEAIETIKKNWPDNRYSMLQEALQILIPELVESKEEKIRKQIIEFIDLNYPSSKTKDDMLDYLNKQEKLDYFDDCVAVKADDTFAIYDDNIENDDLADEINLMNRRYPDVSFPKLTRIASHFVKWQKEKSKSVWNKKDTETLHRIINELLVHYDYNKPCNDGNTFHCKYEDEIKWLENIRQKFCI